MKIPANEMVKWGRMHVRLLTDVECAPLESGQLQKEGGEKSWALKSVVERRAHVEKMIQARKIKRDQAKHVLSAYEEGFQIQRLGEIRKENNASYNEAVAAYSQERENRNAEIEEFTVHLEPEGGIDWSKTDFLIAQATGMTLPAVKKLREQQARL